MDTPSFDPIGPWDDDQDRLRKRMANLREISEEDAKKEELMRIRKEKEIEIEAENALEHAMDILAGKSESAKEPETPQKNEGQKMISVEDGKKIYNFYNCTVNFS